MHIPDGMISPKMYIPLHVVNAGLLVIAYRKIKKELNDEMLPYIASLSALSFVLMFLQVPLPGGTSVHGVGIAPISILFGPWIAFFSIALVLLLQAVLLGVGGITSYSVNSLCIGFVGAFVSYYVFKLLKPVLKEKLAVFLSGFLAIIIAALFIAISLGVQPFIAHAKDGTPLFFPFSVRTTIPVLLIPHIFVGIGEGIITVLLYGFVKGRLENEQG